MKNILTSLCALSLSLSLGHAATITQWNFDAQNLTASTGSGTAGLLGGTTQSFATGNGGGFGWNTLTYAAQGTGSGTRGIELMINTGGFEDIILSYDQRSSGTASRWAQVDYTLNGGTTWTTAFWNNGGGLSPHDTFYSFNVDFSSIAGANNNANFGVRIVSIFSPVAFDQSSTLADYGANSAYMRANAGAVYTPGGSAATGDYGNTGTWRFDNVTFAGTAVPEPASATMILGGLGMTAWMFRRRKAQA